MDITTEGEVVKVDSTPTKDSVVPTPEKEAEPTVPLSRFREVNNKAKNAEKQIAEFRKEISEIKSLLKKDSPVDYEAMSPAELEKRASDIAYERLKEEQRLEAESIAQKTAEAEESIDSFFADIKDDGHDLKESEVNEVIKLALDEFDSDLPKAWKAYNREKKARLEVEKFKAEQKAKEGESVDKSNKWVEKKWVPKRWDDLHTSAQKYFR